ncbi:MAG TPA: CU044_2847 family protein [Ktedonobacteraceae bacterium]
MENERDRTRIIKARLEDGTTIDIQSSVRGDEDIASTVFPFKEVTDKIESIATAVIGTFEKVRPQSASVEFGIEMAIESGHLTALLVKGTGTANLKIILQWGDSTLSVPSI